MQGGTFIAIIGLSCVLFMLLFGIIFSLYKIGWQGFIAAFSVQWNPQYGQYGILPMLVASFLLASLAILIAVPFCLGIMGFLWGEQQSYLSQLVRTLIRFMLSIPTVVYGCLAVILLVPLMRTLFGGTGLHILSTALVLSLLILPTMLLVLDNALHQQLAKPQNLTLGATALGLTRSQIFWTIALPAQRRWFVTAILLGMGRALGDTMLPLMLSGNAPVLPEGPLSSVRSLAAHISLLTSTEISPQVELTLYLAGIFLLLTSTGVSICGKLLQRNKGLVS